MTPPRPAAASGTDPDALAQPSTTNKELWRLTWVTFLALVSEPLYLLADSAIVGHLGTTELAALGVAAAVLGVILSICIFLAYGTTAAVSRMAGAGDDREAYSQGVDGLWLALFAGVGLAALLWPFAPAVIGLFGASAEVNAAAGTYLRISLLGTPAMLIVLAATGVLRGFRDVRTPLVVAVASNLTNIGLNIVLVYPVGLGLAGAAWGTVAAHLLAATALTLVVVRQARTHQARLRPYLPGIIVAMRIGGPLIVRTVMLRAALLLMTWGAARFGAVELATMQLALTIWSFLAFTLDALGISAQTVIGHELGRGARQATRVLTSRLIQAGWWLGVGTGVLLAICAQWLGPLFTSDPAVIALLTPVLWVAAVAQPVAGVVFTLDGVLIGAGDGPYLAWAQIIVFITFAPAAAWAIFVAGTLTWLWVMFAIAFMGSRAVVLLLRARGQAWMRLGRSMVEA